MGDTPGSPTVSTKLQRIAKQAEDYPDTVFNNLYHLLDYDFLMEPIAVLAREVLQGWTR